MTELRTTPEPLLAALEVAGAKVFARNRIACPFHDDKHPSAGVYADDAGVWRFKCHAGGCDFNGDVFDVQARMRGVAVEEVLKEHSGRTQPPPAAKVFSSLDDVRGLLPGKVEATYQYTSPETGEPDLVVFRCVTSEGKTFRQASPCEGGWLMKAPKVRPIYNRKRVGLSRSVVVVEGEKCVHALHDIGIVATTSPGGVQGASYADWTPLRGKRVTIWPDNDAPGMAYAAAVRQIADEMGCEVAMMDPAGLGLSAKGDAADFIETLSDLGMNGKRAAVEDALADAEATGAGDGVRKLIEDTIEGRRKSLPWPWAKLTKLAMPGLPKTVCLLCGDPGASKSFMLIEACLYWHMEGFKIALYELEDDRDHHLHRALAQMEGNADLFDPEWIKDHPEDSRDAYKRHAKTLDGFGRRIWDAPDIQLTHADLLKWVQARAEEGCDLIAVDPVTAVEATKEPWAADAKFIIEAKSIIRKHNSRLLLVTHPKKGQGVTKDFNNLAGGAAYARFPHTILWLDKPAEPQEYYCHTPFGAMDVECNRLLHITKARNGPGQGLTLCMDFTGKELGLVERGVKMKKPK